MLYDNSKAAPTPEKIHSVVAKPAGPPDLVGSLSGISPASHSVSRGESFWIELTDCTVEEVHFTGADPCKEITVQITWVLFEIESAAPLGTYAFEVTVVKGVEKTTLQGSVTVLEPLVISG